MNQDDNPLLVKLLQMVPLSDPEDLLIIITRLAKILKLGVAEGLPYLVKLYWHGSQQEAFFDSPSDPQAETLAAQNLADVVYLSDGDLDPKCYQQSFYNCLHTLNRLNVPGKELILRYYRFINVG